MQLCHEVSFIRLDSFFHCISRLEIKIAQLDVVMGTTSFDPNRQPIENESPLSLKVMNEWSYMVKCPDCLKNNKKMPNNIVQLMNLLFNTSYPIHLNKQEPQLTMSCSSSNKTRFSDRRKGRKYNLLCRLGLF